jgi:Uma2 family endonuclease
MVSRSLSSPQGTVFIQGQAQQQPMPTLFHSRLQRNLVNAINSQTTAYEAMQELECILPPMSPVPDIALVKSERLSDEDGPLQGFTGLVN